MVIERLQFTDTKKAFILTQGDEGVPVGETGRLRESVRPAPRTVGNMATLEVRRHAMRSKPGQNLSQDGVSLARLVGETSGPFDLVISSSYPRATQTAVAMGFAVDEVEEERGADVPDSVFAKFSWPRPIHQIAETVLTDAECQHHAEICATHWQSVLRRLNNFQSGLIVTHGAIIELGAIGMMPSADFQAWGSVMGYCEGFRFTARNNQTICDVLRVPSNLQVIEN